jgi:ferric-chelate reductase
MFPHWPIPPLLSRWQEYPKQLWYFVASGIALLILSNLWSILRRRARRSALLRSAPSFTPTNIYTGPISWRRLPAAIGTAWNIAAYRWTIPYGQNHVLSLTELCVTTLYAAAVFTWSFINCQPSDLLSRIQADFLVLNQPMADK